MLLAGGVVLALGGGFIEALLWAVGAAVATRLVPILLSFPIAYWPAFGRRVPPLGTAGLARLIGREAWATIRLFFFYHPLESFIVRHDPVRIAPGETPIVFVHGFYANAGFWQHMKGRMRAAGRHNLFSLTLNPPFISIDAYAVQLEDRIAEVCEKCGCESVLVIAHSMGGLVSRVCARRARERVRHVICLGTPHYGTVLARLVPSQTTRQMRPRSDWLGCLNADVVSHTATTSIYSEHDNIIVPQAAAALDGGDNITLPGIGHLEMAFSRPLFEEIEKVLDRV